MTLNDATLRQNQAAEPMESTWLSANAGSGKTRVLTDRVARLLLDGVEPQNILCLTYTKAAASEMQNRLFKRLGEWAMKEDPALSEALGELGVDSATDHEQLSRARRLFARAIETPGGLRIQTIHSFCASILRRFPLEAGVSPRFVEMDDRAASLLRDEIIEEMAAGPHVAAIDAVAAHLSDADLSNLVRAVVQNRLVLTGADRAKIWGWFGLRSGADETSILSDMFDGSEKALLDDLLPIARSQSKSYAEFGANLAALDLEVPSRATFDQLSSMFLYASGDRRGQSKSVNFPQSNHKKAVEAFGPVLPDLHAFMDRVEATRNALNSLFSAEKTLALHQFADVFLPTYADRKQAHGWLDFDDLIHKTAALLNNDLVAGWVLFRLDGGLDHILVDEAQDTSPAQWQVIERLAQEFTSGQGARDNVRRTIFVVGDKKQSIYSFQGADPREFDRMREHFERRLAALNIGLRPLELEYSFRSSDAILRFVDQTIAHETAPHPITGNQHLAFHTDLPGRVDLWADVPKTDSAQKTQWFDPVDIVTEDHQDVILARTIASQIKKIIETETIPAQGGQRRPVKPGDFLILVRRRAGLFEEVIRACKALSLPVAGADRLKLGAELAVKDLTAVLSFLATPEDSLSLAAALRSPLFGWDEAALFDLAAGRKEKYLWNTLRNRSDAFPETMAMLNDLRDNADFLRPYDLIERILTRHDGRRRLLARLGPEAEDGIDALLTQSLAFERMEVPSLTGFLVWMATGDVEIKRQVDSAGDLIRVMTVHGAKGLEAPIVILPDTAKRNLPVRDEVVALDQGAVWKANADRQTETVKHALTDLTTKQEEEGQRLFYVAMTRAENWLIIAASGDVGEAGDSWYQLAADGLRALGALPWESPTGPGLRYGVGDWTGGDLIGAETTAVQDPALPDWAMQRAAAPLRPRKPSAPSALGGAKALWDPDLVITDEDAMQHGRRIHLLLEHLPERDPAARGDLAVRLLATGDDAMPPDAARALFGDIAPILDDPDLQWLFTGQALAEVDITASLPDLGDDRIVGTIDRLLVTPDRILAVDFKTNAVVPATPSDTPEAILRQMGAYHAALEQIYPDRPVETAVLWTRIPHLMALPHDIVKDALRRTPHLDVPQRHT